MQTSMRSLRTYLLAGRARLPALHRGSRQDFHILAQLQAMLPGTWQSADPLIPRQGEDPHAVCAGVTRPNLSQSSEHLAPQSVVLEG